MFHESRSKTSSVLMWVIVLAAIVFVTLFTLSGCVQVNKSQNFTLNDYGPDKIAEEIHNDQKGEWASETDTAIEDALKADVSATGL